jgi:hypothetical protein
LGPRQELVAVLHQPARLAHLVGQALDGLVEQVEHLVAVDLDLGRQRRRAGPVDQVVHAVQQGLDVAAGGPLGHAGVEGPVVGDHQVPSIRSHVSLAGAC